MKQEAISHFVKDVLSSEGVNITTMSAALATSVGTVWGLIPSDVGKIAFIITFIMFVPLFIYRILMIRKEWLSQKREIFEQQMIREDYEAKHNIVDIEDAVEIIEDQSI